MTSSGWPSTTRAPVLKASWKLRNRKHVLTSAGIHTTARASTSWRRRTRGKASVVGSTPTMTWNWWTIAVRITTIRYPAPLTKVGSGALGFGNDGDFLQPNITLWHYRGVIMGVMASQITSLTIVYSTVYSGAHQRNHQSSASLAFVRGMHRRPVNSPHKGPVTRKMFQFDDVIMKPYVH